MRGFAAMGAAVALAVGVAVATPSTGRAAGGSFLWVDGQTVVPRQLLSVENETPVLAPPREKCFDTFGATKAINLTDSDAVLAKDGLCSEFLIAVKPGTTYDGPFGSVGFTPPGATDE